VRPLAAVLLFCASCFSQASPPRKPPSLSGADEVRIGKAILGADSTDPATDQHGRAGDTEGKGSGSAVTLLCSDRWISGPAAP